LLQELFGRFEDLATSYSYGDLLGLARALIDTNNPTSKCPTRNLAIILKYWWKGEEFEIPRVLELLISTGRKSEIGMLAASIISTLASKSTCSNKYSHSS
jgi:hypothetical protein